jgi:flagellum-specific peptidoglycan hydrolase FlgJ
MNKNTPDKKKKNMAFPMLHKGMDKSYKFANQVNPELAELIKQIFIILMRPLIALRAKLYRIFLKPFNKFKLEQNKIPIFRIAIISIGIILISQKNISFSFNLSDAAAMIAKPEKTTIYDVNGESPEVKKINEYAPISADKLDRYSPEDYIKRFKDMAISEMKKYGVPASITLAQGLVESRAGNSRLAVQNNNHFGIKCFSKKCAKGHCTNHFDDNHKDFFRKYKSTWESFRAHSSLLQKDRYKKLKSYKKDYKKWAKGLKEAGYATDKKYDQKIIKTIKKYKLYQYDK